MPRWCWGWHRAIRGTTSRRTGGPSDCPWLGAVPVPPKPRADSRTPLRQRRRFRLATSTAPGWGTAPFRRKPRADSRTPQRQRRRFRLATAIAPGRNFRPRAAPQPNETSRRWRGTVRRYCGAAQLGRKRGGWWLEIFNLGASRSAAKRRRRRQVLWTEWAKPASEASQRIERFDSLAKTKMRRQCRRMLGYR